MTQILHFRVDGLAGRREPVVFELQPDMNVFFGFNGTGKTSLLRILHSALRGNAETLSRVPFKSASVTFWSHEYEREITRTIKSHRQQKVVRLSEFEIETPDSFLPAGRDLVAEKSASTVWVTSPKVFSENPFRNSFLSTMRLSGGVGANAMVQSRYGDAPSEVQMDEAFSQHVTLTWRRFNNRLLSDVRHIQSQGLADILQSIFEQDSGVGADSVAEADAYRKAREFLQRQGARLPKRAAFNDRYTSDAKVRSVVNQIDRIESQIWAAERPRRELEDLIEKFMRNKPVELGDRDIRVHVSDDESIDLSLLSSGEKQLMIIMLSVVGADRSVVIVDEPELSLHIDWQQQLLAAMRTLNDGAQIIAATHSPEVMAHVPDRSIFRL